MNNFKVNGDYFDRYTQCEINMAKLLLDICDSGWRERS